MEPPDLGGRDPRDDPVDRHELDEHEPDDLHGDDDYDDANYDEHDEYDDAAFDGEYDDAEYAGHDDAEGDDQAPDHADDYAESESAVVPDDDGYYYAESESADVPDDDGYYYAESESADVPDDGYYYAEQDRDEESEDYADYADDDQYPDDEVADGYVADDDRDRRRRAGFLTPFLLGALVGIVALGMVWGAVSLTGSGESRADTAQNHDAKAAASHSDRITQCRAVGRAETQSLAAARSTLNQWEVHVAAMNRLVVGMITLQQANQFWNQTRRGAARRLTRFLAAEQHLRDIKARTHCALAPDAHASKALRACSRAVAARGRALRVADAAISTWRRHVRDMEMLRMGKMSSAMANQMWLANWHTGVVQLRHYRSAAARAHAGPC